MSQPIETAPKDRRIQLYVPGQGAWADGWWYGSWDYVGKQWVLHVYGTACDRQIHLSELPHQPTHWLPSPGTP